MVRPLKVLVAFQAFLLKLPGVHALGTDGTIILCIFVPVIAAVIVVFLYKAWKEVCKEEDDQLDLCYEMFHPFFLQLDEHKEKHSPQKSPRTNKCSGCVVMSKTAIQEESNRPYSEENNNDTDANNNNSRCWVEDSYLEQSIGRSATDSLHTDIVPDTVPALCPIEAEIQKCDKPTENLLVWTTQTSSRIPATHGDERVSRHQRKSPTMSPLSSIDSEIQKSSPSFKQGNGGLERSISTPDLTMRISTTEKTRAEINGLSHFKEDPKNKNFASLHFEEEESRYQSVSSKSYFKPDRRKTFHAKSSKSRSRTSETLGENHHRNREEKCEPYFSGSGRCKSRGGRSTMTKSQALSLVNLEPLNTVSVNRNVNLFGNAGKGHISTDRSVDEKMRNAVSVGNVQNENNDDEAPPYKMKTKVLKHAKRKARSEIAHPNSGNGILSFYTTGTHKSRKYEYWSEDLCRKHYQLLLFDNAFFENTCNSGSTNQTHLTNDSVSKTASSCATGENSKLSSQTNSVTKGKENSQARSLSLRKFVSQVDGNPETVKCQQSDELKPTKKKARKHYFRASIASNSGSRN